MTSLYFEPHGRSNAQREEMDQLEAAGICIFCPDHITKEGKKEVILENDTWLLVPNDYPYPGVATHLLLVPKEHVEMDIELSDAARHDYWDLREMMHAKFGHDYFVLNARNGNPRYTGATIRHLHFHYVLADPSQGIPVVFYASSKLDVPPT